jgi:hypothetical protein
VSVDASARPMGLGSVHEVLLRRRGEVVLLTSSARASGGMSVVRGGASPSDGGRRQYGRRITFGGHTFSVAPAELAYLASSSMLVTGAETVYEGRTRPPDAFDQRIVTMVRIRVDQAPASS